MANDAHIGRIGSLAVAFGLGAAVVTGWGGGLAWADESANSAGSTTSATTSGAAGGESEPSSAAQPFAKPDDGGATTGTKTTDTSSGTAADDSTRTASTSTSKKSGTHKGSLPTSANSTRAKPPAPVIAGVGEREATATTGSSADAASRISDTVPNPTEQGDGVTAPPPSAATVSSSVATTSAQLTQTPSKPNTANVVSVVTGLVSGIAKAILSPFAATSLPGEPAETPAIWSLLAFARREFDPAVRSPSLTTTPTDAVTTTDTTAADALAAPNSLTYTAPPNIIDQLTTLGLQLMGKVGDITGINFTGVIGTLESTGVPPIFLTFGLHTQETDVEVSPGNVWKVWEFTPANPTGKTVIALHGGGFILQPGILNWIDYTDMARNTGATVMVPLYPLSTTAAGSAINVEPEMADFISQQIDQYGAQNVSIYADSAGVTWAFGAVRDLILAGDPVPASMVLISGAADSSLTNPAIKTIDDPFFNVNDLSFWTTNSHEFDGITDLKDPRVSPLYMETDVLKALPRTTIYIGSDEMLLPDNLLLYQRAADIGAPISMVVGSGLFHDWPVPGFLINSKAAVVRPDIYRELGLLS
jgi:acetyl esterase/lipase